MRPGLPLPHHAGESGHGPSRTVAVRHGSHRQGTIFLQKHWFTLVALACYTTKRKRLHEMEAVRRARLQDVFIKHDQSPAVQLDYLGAARCRENQKQFRARHVSHWKQHPPPSTHNMLICGLPRSQAAFRALRVFKGHQLPECEGLNADPKQSNKSTTVAVNRLRHERLKIW